MPARLLGLCDQPVALAAWAARAYFQRLLAKPLDLVARRLLNGETIPAREKVFSLCEPHPEWSQKGQHRPTFELGYKFLIATEQPQLLQG